MGLDVTAYSRAIVLPDDPEREIDWDNTVHAYAYARFERSTRGLVDHDVVRRDDRDFSWIAEHDYDVTGGETYRWHAGSYGGYNIWRRLLADVAGYTAEAAWDTPDDYSDRPFFELVNFADNEGTIGPDAARDLASDFAKYRDGFAAKGDEWDLRHYDDWARGLSLAADGGLVVLS